MAGYRVKVSDCDAEACGRRCQDACPLGVFLAVPREKDHGRHGANPRYRIVPRFDSFCDGCGECLSACPQGAIRVAAGRRLISPSQV